MASRRILKERNQLEKNPLEYCKIDLASEEDVYNWRVQVAGPPNTPYEGSTFTLDIAFPSQYPFKPPKIKFLTKTYHPSIQTETGEICADLIGEGWGPTLNVRHCLTSIYTMLQTPDGDHPLEETIAAQLRETPKDFEKQAKKFTQDYAK